MIGMLEFVAALFGGSILITGFLAPKPILPELDESLPVRTIRTGLLSTAKINIEAPVDLECGYCSSVKQSAQENCRNCGAN